MYNGVGILLMHFCSPIDMIGTMEFDPFALALGLDSDADDDPSDVADALARSLEAAGAQSMIVLDDAEDVEAPEAAGDAPEATDEKKETAAKGQTAPKRKKTPAAACQKRLRRTHAPKQFVLMEIPPKQGAQITSVFVPTKTTDDAVALWPQFTAEWKGAKLGDKTWIVFSSQSRWLERLIKVAAPSKVRYTLKCVYRMVRQEFDAELTNKRKEEKEKEVRAKEELMVTSMLKDLKNDSESSSDSEDDETFADKAAKAQSYQWRSREAQTPVLEINISGYPVTCMNFRRQCVFACDFNLVNFIRNWLFPFCEKVGANMLRESRMPKSLTQDNSEQNDSQSSADWTSKKDAANISSKVLWARNHHGWVVLAKKVAKNTTFTNVFRVDPELRGEDFEKERTAQERLAIEEWNKHDGTRRVRIPMVQEIEGLPERSISSRWMQEADMANSESGSQPSLPQSASQPGLDSQSSDSLF